MPVVTYALITINLVIFLILNVILGQPICGNPPWEIICINDNMLLIFAQVNTVMLSQMRLYQLVTSIFVHAYFLHLFWNMLGLWYFGRMVEMMSSPRFMIGTFLLTGIAGSISTLTLGPMISLGASGALFGVVGSYSILGWRKTERSKTVISVLIFLLLIHLPILLDARINLLSHASGFLSGLSLGTVYRMWFKDKSLIT